MGGRALLGPRATRTRPPQRPPEWHRDPQRPRFNQANGPGGSPIPPQLSSSPSSLSSSPIAISSPGTSRSQMVRSVVKSMGR